MSKKKLILASAVLSATVFTASCGGGGGGGASSPPPPPPPPPANVIGYSLVQALKGTTAPGALIGYYLAEVRDNGTASFTEITTPFDAALDYVHEYSNNNILLFDVNTGNTYHYTKGAPGTITLTSGCTNLPLVTGYIYLPNFVIGDEGSDSDNDVDIVFTQNGKCIDILVTGSERLLYAGRDYVLIGDGLTNESVYVIRKDGTKSALIAFNGEVYVYDRVDGTDTIVVSASDSTTGQHIYVIRDNGDIVKITNDTNAATGDDPMKNLNSGRVRIARDSGGNLFVAAFDATNDKFQYFKILPAAAGSTVFTPTSPITGVDTLLGSFALDGNGALYTIQNCDGDAKYELGQHFIDGSNIYVNKCVNTAANDDLDNHSMLAFANGVLISNPAFNTFYHYIFNSAQPTNVALQQPVIDAVAFCNQVYAIDAQSNFQSHTSPLYTATPTELIQGIGTNTITCAGSGGTGNIFAWVQVTGPGTYNGAWIDPDGSSTTTSRYFVAAAGNKMVFTNTISLSSGPTATRVCSAGATTCTTASLSKTAFWEVYYPWSHSDNIKIKSDTNVISDGASFIHGGTLEGAAPNLRATYFTDVISSPYIVDMLAGSVDTSTLNIPFSDSPARGGNVNLAMNMVSNVRRPITGASCPSGLFDHLWFKSSTHNFNSLGRPANTCLVNVLGTFSP